MVVPTIRVRVRGAAAECYALPGILAGARHAEAAGNKPEAAAVSQ
jgi:hypothetical protein